MTFKVRLTRDAEADLDRLFDFLVERELARDSGDLELPEQAMTALRAGIATLKSSPFTCRKAGNSPFLRELIIQFGRSGYVPKLERSSEEPIRAGLLPAKAAPQAPSLSGCTQPSPARRATGRHDCSWPTSVSRLQTQCSRRMAEVAAEDHL